MNTDLTRRIHRAAANVWPFVARSSLAKARPRFRDGHFKEGDAVMAYEDSCDDIWFRGRVLFVDEGKTVGMRTRDDNESAATAPLPKVFHDSDTAMPCTACNEELSDLKHAHAARIAAIRASIDSDLVSLRDTVNAARWSSGHAQPLELPAVVPGLRPTLREILAASATFSECPDAVFMSELTGRDFARLYALASDLWITADYCEPPPARQLFAADICPDLKMTLDMVVHVDRTWAAHLTGASVPVSTVSAATLRQLQDALHTCGAKYEVYENDHVWMFLGASAEPCAGCLGHWSRRAPAELVTW